MAATRKLQQRWPPPPPPPRIAAYIRTCARLGQQPSSDVLEDLYWDGALAIDLQFCREPEAVLSFLKEAPAGVQQVVIFDGKLCYEHIGPYRERLLAEDRRERRPARCGDFAWLRQLLASLAAFLSRRGRELMVLELTGLLFGLQADALVPPLGRCLFAAPKLQQLHLAGCHLGDGGLERLLPHLSKGFPKLTHLSLAKNSLHSIRLIAKLLRGRAKLQRHKKAVPLAVLDLSSNPGLSAGLWAIGKLPLPERLLEVVCGALWCGLSVEVLILRSMRLVADCIRPLLHYLSAEGRRREDGMGGKIRGLGLQFVDLEDNILTDNLVATVEDALRELGPSSFGDPWAPRELLPLPLSPIGGYSGPSPFSEMPALPWTSTPFGPSPATPAAAGAAQGAGRSPWTAATGGAPATAAAAAAAAAAQTAGMPSIPSMPRPRPGHMIPVDVTGMPNPAEGWMEPLSRPFPPQPRRLRERFENDDDDDDEDDDDSSEDEKGRLPARRLPPAFRQRHFQALCRENFEGEDDDDNHEGEDSEDGEEEDRGTEGEDYFDENDDVQETRYCFHPTRRSGSSALQTQARTVEVQDRLPLEPVAQWQWQRQQQQQEQQQQQQQRLPSEPVAAVSLGLPPSVVATAAAAPAATAARPYSSQGQHEAQGTPGSRRAFRSIREDVDKHEDDKDDVDGEDFPDTLRIPKSKERHQRFRSYLQEQVSQLG